MPESELLKRLVAQLILRHPFLATLAVRLERFDDPTAETAWTDGERLGVNPAYLAGLDGDRRLTLVAHELYHVALAHHLRRAGRDPDRWNRACDYAVTRILVDDGFKLWDGALYETAYGEASAEAIYSQLPPPSPSPAPPTAGGPPSTGGAGSPSLSSSPSAAPLANPPPIPDPREPRSVGEVRDLPRPSPPTGEELQDLLARHAILVDALAQQARAQGRDSAGVKRACAVAREPATVPWRTLLAEFLSSRTSQDYTWARPLSRYALLGLYLPALAPTAPDNIAFVLDTSGSVPDQALRAVTAELEDYLLQCPGTTLDVLYADARVRGRGSFTAADLPLQLAPIGGGGTDFRPALADLEAEAAPPACIVYLTDLEGTFPEQPPAIPVLWLVFGQPLTVPEAPFGGVVSLPF